MSGGVHFQMIKSGSKDAICALLVCVGGCVLKSSHHNADADTLPPSHKTLQGLLGTKTKV